MASKKIQMLTRNLFDSNISESIGADDLRYFVDVIFQSSESVVRKFDTKEDISVFKTSNPAIKIEKGDIVIVKSEGIFIADTDQPDFEQLTLISPKLSILFSGPDDAVLTSKDNKPYWKPMQEGYHIEAENTIDKILSIKNIAKGTIFIAKDDNPYAKPPGKKGDGYSWNGKEWKNIGPMRPEPAKIEDIAFATQVEVDEGASTCKAVSPNTLKHSRLIREKEHFLGTPAKDGMVLVSDQNNVREWREIDSKLGEINLDNPKAGDVLQYNGTYWVNVVKYQSGSVLARPSKPKVGEMFFDTSVGLPLWFTDKGWIDATGTIR